MGEPHNERPERSSEKEARMHGRQETAVMRRNLKIQSPSLGKIQF